jgi:hypothetical protein
VRVRLLLAGFVFFCDVVRDDDDACVARLARLTHSGLTTGCAVICVVRCLEYGIRNFVFYQPECHSNVTEIVALPSLYHSQNPGLQNLRTAITSFLATRRQHKKHAFTLSLSLCIPLWTSTMPPTLSFRPKRTCSRPPHALSMMSSHMTVLKARKLVVGRVGSGTRPSAPVSARRSDDPVSFPFTRSESVWHRQVFRRIGGYPTRLVLTVAIKLNTSLATQR